MFIISCLCFRSYKLRVYKTLSSSFITIMGRENHDPTMLHSSIALLQERFRQLQRVKEMREERELQKMLTTELLPKQFNSISNNNITTPTKPFSHPEFNSKSPPHVSLSLWPTSQGKQVQEDYTSFKTPMNFSWKNDYDDCDSASDSGVDTSLHL